MNTDTKTQHTPTPWTLSLDGMTVLRKTTAGEKTYRFVAHCDSNYDTGGTMPVEGDLGNADFIVRAVNSHEALLEAAKWSRKTLELFFDDAPELREEIQNLDDAIAQAEGR